MIGWRKSKYTDGPNDSGTFSAGIDSVIADTFGKPDWHLHAIEFHSKNIAESERWRDFVFDAIVKGELMP